MQADTAATGDAAAQADQPAAAASESAQAEDAENAGTKSEPAAENGEGEKNGRSRNRRGRGQKPEAAEQGDSADQSSQGDDDAARSQGQQQNGEKQGAAKTQDNGPRSSRTRQRDRKRRGQGDDFEPEIAEDDVLLPIAGILDVLDNYAFVRTSGYLPGTGDVYVSLGQVKKYGLRRGDAVVGAIRQPRDGEGNGRQKYNAIVKVDTINGHTVEESEKRVDVAELTPVFPQERLRLESAAGGAVARSIDAVAPLGFGQRGLLVVPASVSSTAVLSEIAAGVSENKPDAHLMLVIADAQPEEITQLQRSVRGEVIAAAFDRPAEDQATIAELALDRAKRLVELGHDVVVLVDSIGSLARAFAQTLAPSGRPALDPLDEAVVAQLKRLLAAARNVENGGSLTVLAVAQRGTGVAADKTLLRELRAVVNSEIRFEKTRRGQAPVVDLAGSFTEHTEAMLTADESAALAKLQAELRDEDAAEKLQQRLQG